MYLPKPGEVMPKNVRSNTDSDMSVVKEITRAKKNGDALASAIHKLGDSGDEEYTRILIDDLHRILKAKPSYPSLETAEIGSLFVSVENVRQVIKGLQSSDYRLASQPPWHNAYSGVMSNYPVSSLLNTRAQGRKSDLLISMQIFSVLSVLTDTSPEHKSEVSSACKAIRIAFDSDTFEINEDEIGQVISLLDGASDHFDFMRSIERLSVNPIPKARLEFSTFINAVKKLHKYLPGKSATYSEVKYISPGLEEFGSEGVAGLVPRHKKQNLLVDIAGDDESDVVDDVEDIIPIVKCLINPEYSAIFNADSINYVAENSLGKVRRGLKMSVSSKEIFTAYERAMLTAVIQSLDEPEIKKIALILVLSICTGSHYSKVLSLTCGGGGDISLSGEYRRTVFVCKNAGKPKKGTEDIYLSSCTEVALQLPDIAISLIRDLIPRVSGSREVGDLLEVGEEAVRCGMKALMLRLRAKCGRRFNLHRVESQLRYYMSAHLDDQAAAQILFGQQGEASYIPLYYRRFGLELRDHYRRLASQYFHEFEVEL